MRLEDPLTRLTAAYNLWGSASFTQLVARKPIPTCKTIFHLSQCLPNSVCRFGILLGSHSFTISSRLTVFSLFFFEFFSLLFDGCNFGRMAFLSHRFIHSCITAWAIPPASGTYRSYSTVLCMGLHLTRRLYISQFSFSMMV